MAGLRGAAGTGSSEHRDSLPSSLHSLSAAPRRARGPSPGRRLRSPRPSPGIAPAPSRPLSPLCPLGACAALSAMARPEGPPTLPEPLRRRLVSFSSSVFSDSARAQLGDIPRASPGFPGYRAGTARAGLAAALSLFGFLFIRPAHGTAGGTCGPRRPFQTME